MRVCFVGWTFRFLVFEAKAEKKKKLDDDDDGAGLYYATFKRTTFNSNTRR